MIKLGNFTSATWGSVAVFKARYADGNLAVVCRLPNGEPLATLSVNLESSDALLPNCFYLKAWSENADIAKEALKSGLFRLRDDLPQEVSGFVTASVVEILP